MPLVLVVLVVMAPVLLKLTAPPAALRVMRSAPPYRQQRRLPPTPRH